MAEEPKKPGSHEVGYCKPPKHTQFKKGQSGNPTGKKKGEESIQDKLKKLVVNEIVVTQNGAPTTMTQLDTMLQAAVTKAMKGDLPALKFVTEQLGLNQSDLPQMPTIDVSQADINVLQTHADWMAVLEKAKSETASQKTQEGENDETDKPF